MSSNQRGSWFDKEAGQTRVCRGGLRPERRRSGGAKRRQSSYSDHKTKYHPKGDILFIMFFTENPEFIGGNAKVSSDTFPRQQAWSNS